MDRGGRTLTHPQGPERQSVSSHRSGDTTRDESGDMGHAETTWDTPNASSGGENHAAPHQNPRKRRNSHLSDFDADSALAITRKVQFSRRSESWLQLLTRNRFSDLRNRAISLTELPLRFLVEDVTIPEVRGAQTMCNLHSSQLSI